MREDLGLDDEKSERVRHRLRRMLDDHFDWQKPVSAQTKAAQEAVEADMRRVLPREVLTPPRMKVMWAYMRQYFSNTHCYIKKTMNAKSAGASESRSRASTTTRRAVEYDYEYDDDKDSDVDQLMDDEASELVLEFWRILTNNSHPPNLLLATPLLPASCSTMCGTIDEMQRPAEPSANLMADADFVGELLKAHRDLSEKHRDLSDMITEILQERVRSIAKK
ncbi:hypothetical protein HWV62_36470 [Athelia sp. TMB]|nr:hypothetical protein HWV62_36470 [Athelia sp. TMB]